MTEERANELKYTSIENIYGEEGYLKKIFKSESSGPAT
jgi:hypothetical protein